MPGEETRRGEPITFQQVRDDLKKYLVDEKVLLYLDRILLHGRETPTHNRRFLEKR